VTDLYKALAQLDAIRGSIARTAEFRGYGAESVAATGVLAVGAAFLQAALQARTPYDPSGFLVVWISTAALALLATSFQAVLRARRMHPGLARQMLASAAESLLPPLLAAALVSAVIFFRSPNELWMLPGLWQVFYGLCIFASLRFVPRRIAVVAIWFLATGLLCLMAGVKTRLMSPWEMGFPFGVGQLLIATLLKLGYCEREYSA
jgi:hypothetical protein